MNRKHRIGFQGRNFDMRRNKNDFGSNYSRAQRQNDLFNDGMLFTEVKRSGKEVVIMHL